MSKYINPEKRAHQIVRSLIASGYQMCFEMDDYGVYILRHSNGNRFFINIGINRDKLIIKKNGKPIEL